MSKTLRNVSIVVLAVAVLAIGFRFVTIKIKPGEVGVLTANLTGGLIEEDYGAGFHLALPGLHTWDIFDSTVQTLHMRRRRQTEASGQVEGPLVVRSDDGANVTMDLTLKYRIKKDEVWQLRKAQGKGDAYKVKVRNESVDVLRQALGTLRTEDFYDPTKRQELTLAMESGLQARFDPLNVQLVAILIRDLEFETAFENRIKEKVLARQEVELNQKKTEAAAALGRTNKVIAETDAKVRVIEQEKEKTLVQMRAGNDKKVRAIEADYKKIALQTRSDADLFATQKEAEGIALMREAEANAQSLRRQALSIPGAETLVALELAKNLRLGAMSVSTQAFNPIDVQAVLEKLGVPADK